MKQIPRRAVLVFLVLAELWLLTGFLPQNWQQRMYAGPTSHRGCQKKSDKPTKIELPYEDALSAFMRTPPPEKKKPKKKAGK